MTVDIRQDIQLIDLKDDEMIHVKDQDMKKRLRESVLIQIPRHLCRKEKDEMKKP
jgi:hypothetical protein